MAGRNIASAREHLPGCVRRRETRCVIMKNRGSWCRRKVRKTGITIAAMRRSAPIILSVPFVDWDVPVEDIKNICLAGKSAF